MKQGTAKVQCFCQHVWQDKQYGKNVRVANTTAREPSGTTSEVRCTVCGKLHTVDKGKVT